jgi:hypothetical protein
MTRPTRLQRDWERRPPTRALVRLRVAIVAGCLALFALLVSAAVGRAELRTGHHSDPYHTSKGSPTYPEFRSTTIRYDTTGTLSVIVNFYRPLADPSSTSALRPWSVSIQLGDYYGDESSGTCAVRAKMGCMPRRRWVTLGQPP